jgi:hypothetical protein
MTIKRLMTDVEAAHSETFVLMAKLSLIIKNQKYFCLFCRPLIYCLENNRPSIFLGIFLMQE